MFSCQDAFDEYQKILYDNDKIGKEDLNLKIIKLNNIFDQSYEKDSDKTLEIVSSFMIGGKENVDFSEINAYNSFIAFHMRTRKYIDSKDNNSYFLKLELADKLIEDYQKAFELDKKILARLVCIDRLINDSDKSLDLSSVYFESAGKVIQELDRSKIDWKFVTNSLNRKIRNATSHLNFYYNPKRVIFCGEDLNPCKKTKKCFTITVENFLIRTLPNAVNIIQSFIAASLILFLKQEPILHNKAVSLLEEQIG